MSSVESIEAQLASITEWFERMLDFANRALGLVGQCRTVPSKDDHDFWALVKYAENVQEAATQIDNINNTVFQALAAIPRGDWQDLKGMRNRLAHKFWDIDPEVLWQTVTEEFPELIALLTNLQICEKPCQFPNAPSATFTGKQFKDLQPTEPGRNLTPRNSLTFLAIDKEARAWALSLARGTNGRLLIASSRRGNIQLSVWRLRPAGGE